MLTTENIWLLSLGGGGLLFLAILFGRWYQHSRRGSVREAQSAESSRMLGLAFQSQGQLDMAFDKFRQCPLDEGLMETLYQLALAYERQRRFDKAESVFRYMAAHNPDFRDLMQRLARGKQLAEKHLSEAVPGPIIQVAPPPPASPAAQPMLGKYRLGKALGKGAMGVVYQGLDTKINRVVAIKTLALAQEFDPDELVDVKARFFREAETAGRLSHPHIVTIFDAGEENDLAFIAMEFLKGADLRAYTHSDRLLPLSKVMLIVVQVAEALDYAHENHVVHRDVKPANIMYEPDSDLVKVMDFGVARITDTCRTRTGMVLGTPSYMSPEQLAGKRIDGRSDLFSLGTMLFQLCCGHLPFVGDSMAQLMYKIANEPSLPVTHFNPAVPPCLAVIIARALTKDCTLRYQRGREMAADLRKCLQTTMENEGAGLQKAH